MWSSVRTATLLLQLLGLIPGTPMPLDDALCTLSLPAPPPAALPAAAMLVQQQYSRRAGRAYVRYRTDTEYASRQPLNECR